MARRMTLEGAEVKMVCELQPYPGGLTRNIVQCLDDFNIPLKLSHTVVHIHGKERLEGVTVVQVDESRKPLMETAECVECDTLLLSVGLIPENELSEEAGIKLDTITLGPVVDNCMETSVEGIFACGNVVHVHDLVDYVSEEGARAGEFAAKYILEDKKLLKDKVIRIVTGAGVRYTVPQFIYTIDARKGLKLFFRVAGVYTNTRILLKYGNDTLYENKKIKVTPGEMECVELSAKVLEQMNNSMELIVELERN
jgi:NADPH-dependent 2,4-dienoyl-CoA reductase/sulfur reductase-like enzyme